MCTCMLRFIERWGSSARVRGSRRGWGSYEVRDAKALHKEAKMETTRYTRKTSETSIKILKKVGMARNKIVITQLSGAQ